MIFTRGTSDWHGNAFTLSLIGYTSTCEIAVRNSDWLYRLFSHVKIKRIDFGALTIRPKVSKFSKRGQMVRKITGKSSRKSGNC